MRHFNHVDVTSFDQAVKNAGPDAWIIAGGTDLLGTLKDEILREYPSQLVNIKTIKDADTIVEEGGGVRIGALVKVKDIAASELIGQRYACLAQAAAKVASPAIRSMGTIGGNICQQHRCWYFRCADNRFDCIRKGGSYCPALIGDNRYHSIFGDSGGCYAVSSQETAPALIALGATIRTTTRELAAMDFFAANGTRSTVLEPNEVVKEIHLPSAPQKSSFSKYALRKAIDFALVNCAVALAEDGAPTVVLGGVYPTPWRSLAAEQAISSGISEGAAKAAGDAAVAEAKPLAGNAYKVEIARALVKRTIMAL